MCVCVCLVVSDSLQPRGQYIAQQAPLSLEFSRQEYWNGLPLPPGGDLPTQGWNPDLLSPLLTGRFFTTVPPGKPLSRIYFPTKPVAPAECSQLAGSHYY